MMSGPVWYNNGTRQRNLAYFGPVLLIETMDVRMPTPTLVTVCHCMASLANIK
jgi:hypothetical protein